MQVSIIIVSWNGRSDLRQCLLSIRALKTKVFETIVVDNNSGDGSREMICNDFPEVILLENDLNQGFARGNNQALEVAKGQWIMTLNQDTTLDPDCLRELLSVASSGDSKLGMLQPLVVFRDDSKMVNSTGVVLKHNGNSGDRDFKTRLPSGDDKTEVFCVTAGAALYRRTMLKQLELKSGVFDDSFFMYCEDLDLGWRARLAGWQAQFVSSAVVHHRYQGSSASMVTGYAAAQCRKNRLRALAKNASAGFITRAIPRSLVDLVREFRFQGVSALSAFWKAVVDGLRQRREVEGLLEVSRKSVENAWVGRN